MAVSIVAQSGEAYQGLSSDTKPIGVAPGSTFIETDTNLMYRTWAGNIWVPESMRGSVEIAVNTSVLVATTPTLVLAANTMRVDADLTNDGDDVIYLARGGRPVLGKGIRLAPNGGTYSIRPQNLFRGAVYGISAASEGTTRLSVSEGS